MTFRQETVDVAIIGAGPAGLSAGAILAESGLSVTLIDEFPLPGGRMLGQFHEEPGQGWWIGRHIAAELVARNETAGVVFRCGTSVHGLKANRPGWTVLLPLESIHARYLLLATGAGEVPLPLPGWTLPGVMSIGAAQVLANVHHVKPGERGMIVGANVLGLAIARELSVGGVSIAGIVLPADSPFSGDASHPANAVADLARLAQLAPSPLLRFGGWIVSTVKLSTVASRFYPRKGIRMWGIPLKIRTFAQSINGTDKVESITLVDRDRRGDPIPGSARDEPVDFVALAGGLYPMAELASIAGCPFVFVPELGGHVPLHSPALRTAVEGLYVAGNITGIESAQVAMSQGTLAGTSICVDAGITSYTENNVIAAIAQVNQVRHSATIQFHPQILEGRQRLTELWRLSQSKDTPVERSQADPASHG